MSERIKRLVMRAFRGVPGEMTLDFGEAQSIAVLGDNGTGKSTIADALEWYFTGNIELLAHEGRQHAVRNLCETTGESTSVELDTTGSLGGVAVHPGERKAEILDVACRETFLLRGRTLADFINKTKTEKWKAVVEILGLDSVEALRQDLQKARNELRKEAKAVEERLQSCRQALGGSSVPDDRLIADLQDICRGLGVEPPQSLDTVIDPSWIASITDRLQSGTRAAQHGSLTAEVETLRAPDIDHGVLGTWNEMISSGRATDLLRLSLLHEADSYLKKIPLEGRCPLCRQTVEEKTLAAELQKALQSIQETSDTWESCKNTLQGALATLKEAETSRQSLRQTAEKLGIRLSSLPDSPMSTLSRCIQERSVVELPVLDGYRQRIERWDEEAKSACREATPPTPDSRAAALVTLAQISELIRSWRLAEKQAGEAKKAAELAERVFAAYQERQQKHLADILKRISNRVAGIYGKLHPGEALDRVSVEPWTAKGIELAIDFHGSRQRPPHGVLSESHLNSLAIALFLAMAETFNQRLRFLVLDDVINSFDLEHRGQLADLLAQEFREWQLIVLTHDHQFYEHLTRRASNWKTLELTSWSYDEGPRTTRYETAGMLAAARRCLTEADGSGAAMKARRALEELLQEVCEGIAALLPYRRGVDNDRREVGQLISGLRRTLRDKAKAFYKELDPRLTAIFADVQATLNVEAHAGRGRASATEIRTVLDRIDELDAIWSCPSCETRIWLKGTPDSSQCRCGQRRFPPVDRAG